MSFDPINPPYNSTDPNASFLSSSCFDFLLIEIVPMAYRVTNELAVEPEARTEDKDGQIQKGSGSGEVKRVLDEDEERDAVFYRLENLGYRVGQGLVER
jgi:hypothetical protein